MLFWRLVGRPGARRGKSFSIFLRPKRRSARRREVAAAGFSQAKECDHATSRAHWRLHRFLFVLSPRAQCRHDVAWAGKRAHAKLEMAAGRLSRARQFHCHQRNRCAAAIWPNQTARCRRADFRSDAQFRLRTRNGVFHWTGKLVRRTDSDRAGAKIIFSDWS